jgi:hypothetical protein
MCVPLWNNRDVIGLIYIDSRRRAGLFNEDHLRLLAHLANVAAVKIENVRLFEQQVQAQKVEAELARASEIQKILLPAQSPPIPGYLLHGSSEPARVVGGDLFDYIDLPGGRIVIALGDVAGKGYPAALSCAPSQQPAGARRARPSAGGTIDRLNKPSFRRFPDNRFVTFFYGILTPPRTPDLRQRRSLFPWILRTGDADELGRPAVPRDVRQGQLRVEVVVLEPGSSCEAARRDGVSNPAGDLRGGQIARAA